MKTASPILPILRPIVRAGMILLAVIGGSVACKKSSPDYTASIVGKWRYINSTVDSLRNGQWDNPRTAYDSTVGPNLGDSLQFTASDTLYYTYDGSTVWSNYKVEGSRLILIGSTTRDTLQIHGITGSQLQIGTQTDAYYYWMNFSKYP